MYFKHVRLYKRHVNLKKSKRKVTLSHFDAVLRCYALIIKMARLRFPGRPGQRSGKNYVKYIYDDIKLPTETCIPVHNKIEVGLKLFHELFGYSDEEEDFDGFTTDDIAEAEAVLALKLTQKQAVQHYLNSTHDPPSGASDIEKLFPSSDSDASTSSSIRQKRGMRDILRRSYDKMIKDGFSKSAAYNKGNTNLCKERDKLCIKAKCAVKKDNQASVPPIQSELHVKRTAFINNQGINVDPQKTHNSDLEPAAPQRTSIVKHLMEKAKQRVETRGRRRKNLRPNLRRKLKNRFAYSTSKKYSNLKKELLSSSEVLDPKVILKNQTLTKINSVLPKSSLKCQTVIPSCSNSKDAKDQLNIRPKRTLPNCKKFILPSRSIRSARKIIPRKRYIDETYSSEKRDDDDSQCSRSSISGSSETTSAMDGGSSPDDSQCEDTVADPKYLKRKVGLLDRPLVVEGKRPWKPSLKVQMKLSEMNYEYPFALKKSGDGSSGTNTSSGSFKDIIKPDMVSKYAEKMAQKPKEKSIKPPENLKKNVSYTSKDEREDSETADSDMDGDKKPEDKLEKVAAKIEKLLKSQWEGRLKDSSKSNETEPTNLESAVAQWKNEHQQRASSQRRTKNIIRKARLQLKKKNLNLRARRSVKDPSPINSASIKKSNKSEVVKKSEKLATNLASTDTKEVPSKDISTATCDSSTLSGCTVCGFSKLFSHPEKLYDQASCEACNKFFESFAKAPKQYFCTKDGNCIVDSTKEASRKLINARCKACWLKICMEKFTVSTFLRTQLTKYVPRLDSPPHIALILDSEVSVDIKAEGILRGPRIKHVCRRAAVALGLPRATFPKQSESKESFNLSALPQEEKQKILETVPLEETVKSPEAETVAAISESKTSPIKVRKAQVKRKTHKAVKVKNRVHMDLLKKSSLLIQKEQKRRKLLMKKSMKHMHKHSFKKSLKLGRRNEMKKTLKFSYKSAVKTSVKSSQKTLSTKKLARTGKFRKVRCKQCEGCLADDCGKCAYCLDKKKFGGPDTIKQACMYRRCLRPVLPASERKSTKHPKSENSSKDKSFGNHSNFGGDGPSGIGHSLTSSSSSPSSPDNSSCGSSCSSSSSSSSSGSSGSSTSSSSGSNSSTTSSSTSDNISISHSSTLVKGSIKVPFLQNTTLGSIIQQKGDYSDVNVVTNPVLQVPFCNEEFDSESDFQDLAHYDLSGSSEQKVFNGNIVNKENGDTILYENSSSIIQLKNASYTPSLIYGAAFGEEDNSVSYSSNSGGCRNSSSRPSGGNLQHSQYNRDQDQYGSAGSGDQESNDEEDDDGGDKEDDYKKKHFIYADYWEDYDFERISSQGFALISSQQIPLPCVCYLCGSAGEEKLIFCVLCCEPYHSFCLPENDVPHEENIENWCCKRCQSCAVCGLKTNLLKCKKCQNTYHSECLTPHYPTKPSRKKRIWMCPKCVKCKSCGTTSPASGGGPLWNFDLLLCQSCAKLTDKGIDCF